MAILVVWFEIDSCNAVAWAGNFAISGVPSWRVPSGVVILASVNAKCSSCFDMAMAIVGMLVTKKSMSSARISRSEGVNSPFSWAVMI